jgi:hypothetical protein
MAGYDVSSDDGVDDWAKGRDARGGLLVVASGSARAFELSYSDFILPHMPYWPRHHPNPALLSTP